MSVGKKYVTKDDMEAYARKMRRKTGGTNVGSRGTAAGSTTGGAEAFTDLSDVPHLYGGEGLKIVRVKAGENGLEFAASSAAHDLLSNTHSDALADTVVAGDLIIGNATPKWARLGAGAEGQILEMGASLPGWGRKITISASDPSGGSDGDIWMKY